MKLLILIFSLLSPLCILAQSDTITHIVERGESLEYLAEKYKTTEDDIRGCNSNLDLFYTGMELRIPVIAQIASVGSAPYVPTTADESFLLDCLQADEYLNNGENKKAEKEYTGLINRYSSSLSCTDAYYGRALAYYNRGKWKKAIRDFNTVLESGDCTEKVRSQCTDLLAKAQEKREAQLQERGEILGSLFAVAAVTTATVISAKNTSNSSKSETHVNGSESNSSQKDYGDEEDEDVTIKCSLCRGKGSCYMCGGDGIAATGKECRYCKGSGICHRCDGAGDI